MCPHQNRAVIVNTSLSCFNYLLAQPPEHMSEVNSIAWRLMKYKRTISQRICAKIFCRYECLHQQCRQDLLHTSAHFVLDVQNFVPEMDEHQQLWWPLEGNSNGGPFGGANSILAALASVAMLDGVRVSQKERCRKHSVCVKSPKKLACGARRKHVLRNPQNTLKELKFLQNWHRKL